MGEIRGRGTITDFNRKKQVGYVQFHAGVDENGKTIRINKTFYNCPTITELRRKMAAFVEEYNARRDTTTVDAYIEELLEHMRNTGEVSKSTLNKYQWATSKILPVLGSKAIQDVTTPDCRRFRESISHMSQNSQCTIWAFFRQVMGQALLDGTIAKNPAIAVKSPRTPKTSRKSLSEDEARRLVTELMEEQPDGHVAAALIIAGTGCRKGEALGLEWQHISENRILFEQQLTRADGLHGLKGGSEPRVVPIGSTLAGWLDAWRENCPGAFVCSNIIGQVITPANLTRWWRHWCVKHGFAVWVDDKEREYTTDADGWLVVNGKKVSRSNHKPKKLHYRGLKMHELRHTQASLLLAAGVDIKTVQARGGWTTPRVPLEVYAHAQKEKEAMAAETLEGILFKNAK